MFICSYVCIYLRLWSQILVVGAATFAQGMPYQSGILTQCLTRHVMAIVRHRAAHLSLLFVGFLVAAGSLAASFGEKRHHGVVVRDGRRYGNQNNMLGIDGGRVGDKVESSRGQRGETVWTPKTISGFFDKKVVSKWGQGRYVDKMLL